MTRINCFALLAFALCILSGCIRENRDDCKGDVTLRFLYNGDGTTDIFPEKIDRVNMYVYKVSDNALVGEYAYDRKALKAYQGAEISLFPGDYKIVCWGNAASRTRVEPSGDDARVAEPCHFENSDRYTGIDSLYYGTTELRVPASLKHVEEVCPFAGAHIKMRVRLKGFANAVNPASSGSRTAGTVLLTHKDCPQWTDFANIPSDRLCDVVPEMGVDPSDASSYILKYNVLRFSQYGSSALVLTDPGDGHAVYTVSLAEFVSRYGIRIEGRNEVTVPVQIELLPTRIEVVEWKVEDVTPGFDKE